MNTYNLILFHFPSTVASTVVQEVDGRAGIVTASTKVASIKLASIKLASSNIALHKQWIKRKSHTI